MFTINEHSINGLNDLSKLPKKEDFEINIVQFLEEWYSPINTINSYTSGSTGKPKIIELKKEAVLKSADLTTTFFQLKKGNKALLCLPTNFIAGKLMLIRSLVAELDLISVPPSRNPLKNINFTIDFAAMTPMQVKTILIENPEKLNLISTLIIGGAPVDQVLENSLKNFSTTCYSTFGMTETITHIALKKLNHDNSFQSLPSVTFNKTADNCLSINAPYISNNSILTNDKIELISPTSFIWKGRKDNVINTGGIKIQAEELELQISQLLPYNRFFTTTLRDELLGEKIILVVEAHGLFDTTTIKFDSLTNYSQPKAIYTIPTFIETETGKIKREENKALLNLK